ncbi:CHASE3 domain-containing protein [Desertivirga arenae]|uniref:CHASE3 domain-containing protein n=1 Tax=Desertivirga arenae TaxID=2810309 RepID=UPI001A9618D3|nr:CHASE3 domain-containing protein [Pedobacter sp. SYSU D00823]
MFKSFSKNLVVGLVVTTALLVTLTVVSFLSVRRSEGSHKWLLHTQLVLRKVNLINISLLKMEEQAKNYVLTGRKEDYQQYVNSTRFVSKDIPYLKNLVADNASQHRRIESLEIYTAQRIQELNKLVDFRKTNPSSPALPLILQANSSDTRSAYEKKIDEFRQAERRLGKIRTDGSNRDSAFSLAVLFSSTVPGFAFIFLLFFFIRKTFKEKENLNRDLLETIGRLQEQDKTLEKIKEFQFLADSLPHIIWTASPEGNTDYFNKFWYDYSGLTRQESISGGSRALIHPDDLAMSLSVREESFRKKVPYQIELRIKNAATGEYKWFLAKAAPYFDNHGNVLRWFGSSIDIDEYKRALDLENKITQYEDFNRIVAHNLRGPAGSIDMMLDLIADTEAEEERAEYFELLKGSSKSLNATLNDLMKVLEIRLSKHVEKEDCELESMIKGVCTMLNGQIATKEAKISLDLDIKVISYPKVYLESIIYNMVSNSLKYSKDNEIPVIQISSKRELNRTVLRFKDNGLGIDLKRHGKNLFKMGKTFHAGYDSKGVGLFMTKTQIETFGGSIEVESAPGEGSQFTVTL